MKGSIEKRGVFTWRLRVDLGYYADGRRNRPGETIEIDDPSLMKMSEKCKGYKDAGRKLKDYLDDQLSDFKRRVLSGEYIKSSDMTFKEFTDNHWRPKYASDPDNLSEYSAVIYDQHLRNHIFPNFGHLKLQDITTMHITDFKEYLKSPEARKDGRPGSLDADTQIYALRVLKNVLERAKEWQVIDANPCKGVKWPKSTKEAVKVYDGSEIGDILIALEQQPTIWRLLILATFLGAFRRGEVITLEIDDCDFGDNRLQIDENSPAKIKGRHLIKGPKNKSSERWVVMPEWYMQELQDYVNRTWKKQMWEAKAAGKWKAPEDRQFLFHKGDGIPYHPNTPYSWWREFLAKNGFRYIKLHGLRHTSATYLLERGIPAKAVAERLGHANEKMLQTTYSHVTKSMEDQAATEFDRFGERAQKHI
ncbi:tyrosine-type recombinase/integrase [Paenibacillus senegalimassiliensis]|uniref:tyrosine-type recombinase/integrase n=1 Tax=Paenibacillus senegalimassiliensis TaxID=1737426 RepID=UPI00073EDC56|nr:site-specific integrase [Paenibacillus senegalimassiliensis]